jgi:hypothetical protein
MNVILIEFKYILETPSYKDHLILSFAWNAGTQQ